MPRVYLLCLNQIPTAPDLILLWMSSIRSHSIVCSLYCRHHLDGDFKLLFGCFDGRSFGMYGAQASLFVRKINHVSCLSKLSYTMYNFE